MTRIADQPFRLANHVVIALAIGCIAPFTGWAVGTGRSSAGWNRPDAAVMRVSMTWILLVGLLASLIAGCGRGASPIPSGAQEVHVIVTGADVRLDPAVAHAGDIYVVLDTPGSSVGYLERKATAEETPGPLTDDDLARIARGGDAGGFSMSGFQAGGCDESQNKEDFGRTGPCGNVQLVTLAAGRYVFFTGTLEEGPPTSMAVLEVLP